MAVPLQEDVRECFDLFDRDGSGKIETELLGKILRSLGQTPSNLEVADMAKEIDPDGSGSFDFASLTTLLERHWKPATKPEDVIEAFKIFDPSQTGQISTAEMRSVMTTLGEKLTTDEVTAMIKEADPDGTGKVDYAEFVKKMHASTIPSS